MNWRATDVSMMPHRPTLCASAPSSGGRLAPEVHGAMQLYGKEYSPADLRRRCGTMRQLGGPRQVTLADGKARGMRAVEVRTGGGLAYTVDVERGMDLGLADYRGLPLCWRSSVGDVHPAFFEPVSDGWLRSFGGGLQV